MIYRFLDDLSYQALIKITGAFLRAQDNVYT